MNERENEKFFCLLNTVVCIATVMSAWSPEWEKEGPDLSQSEKGSWGIQFRIKKKITWKIYLK